MQPQLSIILVNFNGKVWLEKCLPSFENIIDFDPKKNDWLEVILVDNGSTDDSKEYVKKHFPWVNWVGLPNNTGFSGGNNVGIQRASSPYIMLLNTDTEFFPGTDLQSLLQNFQRDSRIGIVSPKVVLDSGELDHASHRGFPSPWNAVMYFSGIAKIFPWFPPVAGYKLSWKNVNSAHEIDACTGAAMIVRKSAMDEVGLLDEAYFMYAEDIDWCFRFKQAAWKVWFDPSVKVLHHKHKSGMGQKGNWETKERSIAAFYDTMKQFLQKFYGHYPRIVLLGIFFVIDTMKQRKLHRERKQYGL